MVPWLVIIGCMLVFLTYIILRNMTRAIEDLNGICQSKVYIVGYETISNSPHGIVLCKAVDGRIVKLIDAEQKLRHNLVYQTAEPVWISFHVKSKWAIFIDVDIYIDGIHG